MLADTHAHLYWDSFKDDFDEVIKKAVAAKVSYIINIGVDIKTSRKALEQVKNYPWPKGLRVLSTIGIHPHEALRLAPLAQGKLLEEIYRSAPEKVVAVGECGLDYKDIDEQTKKAQRKLFQAQIDLAKKLHLPLIVHCRDAWDEVLQMTKDHFGIYHCYSGLPSTTNLALNSTNFLVSFACNITYPKNDYLLEAIKLLPLDRIVLETDSPFLPPQIQRGKRNEPANVVEAAKVVAHIKNLSLEELARQTTTNVVNLLSA
ncbi:TatD family hydrolase [Candidatus Daviesbacteria bacterium]|nr:TatD family hydrolase [Candidatus Daviesbacteria bacterium]